jgi:hypothetical protein
MKPTSDKKYMIVRFYEDFSAEIVLRDLPLDHANAWVSNGAITPWFVEQIREQTEEHQ